MKKQEIFKLQLDAFMQPFVMWRIETTKNVSETPMELLQDKSLWEWNEDIEHDACTAYWMSSPEIYNNLVQEIVECLLMQVSSKGTLDEYENIGQQNFNDLYLYVEDKLRDIIRNEAFYECVFDHYLEVYSSLDSSINNLLK